MDFTILQPQNENVSSPSLSPSAFGPSSAEGKGVDKLIKIIYNRFLEL